MTLAHSVLISVIGPSCTGKTWMMDFIRDAGDPRIGLVEVGRYFREKYLDPKSPHYQPDYFKGQMAPAHTQKEAWDVLESSVNRHLADGKRAIVIDGQPREVGQAHRMLDNWTSVSKMFVVLHASPAERERRALAKVESEDNRQLRLQRLQRDIADTYEVLLTLIQRRTYIKVIDTEGPHNEWRLEVMQLIRSCM